jgi:predicted nucleic acid-binding protein
VAVLIDTDVLVDLERPGSAAALERVAGDEERAISVLTVPWRASRHRRAPSAPQRLRRARSCGYEPDPDQRARRAGARRHLAELAQRGQVVGAHELWIAATGVAHDLAVATGNVAPARSVAT